MPVLSIGNVSEEIINSVLASLDKHTSFRASSQAIIIIPRFSSHKIWPVVVAYVLWGIWKGKCEILSVVDSGLELILSVLLQIGEICSEIVQRPHSINDVCEVRSWGQDLSSTQCNDDE